MKKKTLLYLVTFDIIEKNVNSLQISGGKWLCKIAYLTNSGNKLFPSQRESQNEKKTQIYRKNIWENLILASSL